MPCSNPINQKGTDVYESTRTPDNRVPVRGLEIRTDSIDDGNSDAEAERTLSPPLYYLAAFVHYLTLPFRTVKTCLSRRNKED
ncbi:MAG: hypothetical protein KKE50_03875 [Nanoarchaeota archaeon]|nr:hypothetical protein [Nanoarchaeota archaeon]